MTNTSTLFCYDLTTTCPYTLGLHISLCGHFCSHSSLPPMIGNATFPTKLHRLHISNSPILTSQHTEQLGPTMVCYLHSKRGQCTLLSSLTWRSTILVNVLFLNYVWIMYHYQLDSYYFTRPYYMISLFYPWGIIHHLDYHGSNESKNYTDQELLQYLG